MDYNWDVLYCIEYVCMTNFDPLKPYRRIRAPVLLLSRSLPLWVAVSGPPPLLHAALRKEGFRRVSRFNADPCCHDFLSDHQITFSPRSMPWKRKLCSGYVHLHLRFSIILILFPFPSQLKSSHPTRARPGKRYLISLHPDQEAAHVSHAMECRVHTYRRPALAKTLQSASGVYSRVWCDTIWYPLLVVEVNNMWLRPQSCFLGAGLIHMPALPPWFW